MVRGRFKQFVRALPLVVAALTPAMTDTPANASTATGSVPISATVLAQCDVSATSLSFGNYSSAQLDGSATVSVTCTNGTPYTVALDTGSGSGATVPNRAMTGPSSAVLNYSLYRDTGRSQVWGQTVGTDTLAGTGTGSLTALTVYGRIPAGQHPAPGAYTDTVSVTLAY